VKNLQLGSPLRLGYNQWMRRQSIIMAAACAAVCACGDSRADLPFAGVNGGRSPDQVKHDSGSAQPDDDAGPAPDAGTAVTASSCEKVAVLATSSEDTPDVTSTDSPDDFLVSRQAVRWGSDCTNPTLTIELSDGNCPDGLGHQLDLTFSVNEIEGGGIHTGNNEIFAAPDSRGIDASYRRPGRLRPTGTWASCGIATGQIVFLEPPELTIGKVLWARYQLLLADCSDSTKALETVRGAFKLTLRNQLSEVCPDRTR
jgi:hypothetical protein